MLDESKSDAIVKELSLLAVKNGHVTKEDIRRSLGAELAANENYVDDMMNLLCEQDITVLENGGTPVCANLGVDEPQAEEVLEEEEPDDDPLLDDEDGLVDDGEDLDVVIDDFDHDEPVKKATDEDGDDDDDDEDESELDDDEPTSMKHAWTGMGTDDDAAGGNRYVDISKIGRASCRERV